MTRASLRTLAAVFLLGAALAPAAALAQSANSSLTGTPLVSQSATLNNNLPQISTDGTVSAGQNNPTNVTTNASTLNGQTQSQQPAPSANAPVNNSLNKGEPTSLDSLLEWVVQIFAGIVYIAGTALNVAAYYSIVKMGDLVGQLSPLQVAWGVFRDLGNIAILFGSLLGGASIVETIFNWRGIGQWALDGVLKVDVPIIQGFVIVAGLMTLLLFLLLDLVVLFLDPRVSYE